MAAELGSDPGIEEQQLKIKVEEFMKKLDKEVFKDTPLPDSDRESEINDENAELRQLKALDSKAGIQPEKFSGREEEFAECDDLHCGFMELLDPSWEHILSAIKTEKEKIKPPDDFFKKHKISVKLKGTVLNQMNITLLKYTEGATKTRIQSRGKSEVLDSHKRRGTSRTCRLKLPTQKLQIVWRTWNQSSRNGKKIFEYSSRLAVKISQTNRKRQLFSRSSRML